jgi:hypothetical protein
MTQAAICSLESFAPEEMNLSVAPVLSFFTTSFAQCTKYAKQLTLLQVYGTVSFGETLNIPLNKNDMIGRVYIVYTIPGIRHWREPVEKYEDSDTYKFCDYSSSSSSSSSSSKHKKRHSSSSSTTSSTSSSEDIPKDNYVYWNDSIAHVITESVCLQVAGVPVNTHSGEYLDAMDQYTTKPGAPTDENVGRYKREQDLWRASRRPQQRVVRLRFHFCENIGKALPVFAIRKSTVRVQLKLRPLEECYFSCDGTVPHLINVDAQLRPADIKVEVAANVYHLTKAERAQIYGEDHAQLMHQVQEMVVPLKNEPRTANLPIGVKLEFKHPVTELFWVIQDDSHLGQKDWYNYSGVNREDPLEKVKISIGGKDLFPLWKGKWFRTIEPMECHTNIPKKHIYSLSFAVCPEDETFHSGYINFTAVDDVVLHLVLQRGLGHVWFKAWAKTLNLFRVKNGEVGLGWI